LSRRPSPGYLDQALIGIFFSVRDSFDLARPVI
jgi:hypothetical protein